MSQMKKYLLYLLMFFCFLFLNTNVKAQAITPLPIQIDDRLGIYGDPPTCYLGACPNQLRDIYTGSERCATDFEDFKKNPTTSHYWVEDPRVTTQGKADERARQFIYWVVNTSAIDTHPGLTKIWNNTRNISYFFTILVAAIMGLGLIIGQRGHFETKIKVWPLVWKILGMLLFITFSASIVIALIQLSEIMMKFFTENLGGKDIFNIYFGSTSTEKNYVDFIGCRDLNYRVQESVGSELFLLKLTNITYYIMGTMLLLRKILLWFLLFVAPFLAILFPFVFIRNIAWIWIGVFFQWLFYGPLFALFLGGLASIWKAGIPYPFDFSRVDKPAGYIFPTAINILYGGPAQKLATLNNGNYIDTFVEYVITLIMLLAVTFFPWWLLRIFRDYCCDGINASKNILMSMYDQMRNGQPPTGPTPPTPSQSTIGSTLNIPKQVDVPIRIKMETIAEIRKTKSEDISRSLNLSATKLTDVAHYETNKQVKENFNRNLNFIANPTKAETPTERQKFMNIRTELFNRAVKEDRVARQILSVTSISKIESVQKKQEILKTIPQVAPASQIASNKFKISQEKVTSLNNTFTNSIATNNQILNSISKVGNVTTTQVQNILTSFKSQYATPSNKVVANIVKETGVAKEQVSTVLGEVSKVTKTNKEVVKDVAQKENVSEEQVANVVESQIPAVAEPEKNVEQTVAVPPSISIEDYEQVKKMWQEQYDKGEVPVTENITSRSQWVEQDTVFITNTLNKLVSSDETIRMQGLDDISYILPVFLINNLKGEELIVYLKAKLEAAKTVSSQLSKEKEITEKLKAKSQEEMVDIERPKTEVAAKTMELKQELPNTDVK